MAYIPNTPQDQAAMLRAIGVGSVEELLREIPSEVRSQAPPDLGEGLSELELLHTFSALAGQNVHTGTHTFFLGGGAYDHYIPSVVGHLVSRSEFYTAYTPYQAEMSQGLLQSIYEYQSMICELTGLDVANASLYDGSSALAEAALMACRITRREKLLLSQTVHPRYRQVVRTYLSGLKIAVEEIPSRDGRTALDDLKARLSPDCAAVLVQHPNFYGGLETVREIQALAHDRGALMVVLADPLSLGVLAAPGEYGADIAVGEGQALGNPLNFGGPFLGFCATREVYLRQLPGRIVGATVDRDGHRGYCLTLQAREQHIRRQRATSNICTNQALVAIAATIYLATMGRDGLREVGLQCLHKAREAHRRICQLPGFSEVFSAPFFKEFVVKTPCPPSEINRKLLAAGIVGGLDLGRFDPDLENHMLWCVTEKRTIQEVERLVEALSRICAPGEPDA